MKCLFYFYSCFNSTFMGGLMDEAIELAKNPENEVLFVYCGGLNNMCLFNRGGSSHLCKFCSSCTKRIIEQYGIHSKPLTDYSTEGDGELIPFDNLKTLRSLTYRDVNVGLGIMSSYISATRNMNPVLNSDTIPYFEAHVRQMTKMIDAVYKMFEIEQPDIVYNFNGRYEEVRALYDITQALNIKAVMTEGTRKDGKWVKVHFEDHLPHDIKNWVKRRDYNWDHLNMTKDEKIKIGESFFYNRRHGIYAGDKIYVKGQKDGNIPPIDKSKINIAIMNSSEDEFAAVGAEWDSLKYFPTQNEGIIWLLENSDPRIHYYLRIHPNLKDIPYKYHTDLLNLGNKYSNITVIPGNSVVSTYTLLDNMDKVIVFGSTMGIESAYWKIPTINLGPAMYYFDGICYEPKDNDDLKRLLVSRLKPLYSDSFLKYGAVIMNNDPLIIPTHNIVLQPKERKLLGFKYHSTPFINFLFNEKITSLYIAMIRKVLGWRTFNKFEVPVKEA